MTWAKQGYIELTEGDETDYRRIRSRISEIGKEYSIVNLAVDRLFQGAELCQNLSDDGFDVIPFGHPPHRQANGSLCTIRSTEFSPGTTGTPCDERTA